MHQYKILKRCYLTQNDRMAADMAVELKEQNVACVSLWPGAVMTEHVNDFLSQPQDEIVIFLN